MPRAIALPWALAALLLAAPALADCPNTFSHAFGSTGTGPAQFSAPERCATDLAGNVYVVDNGNSRICKWSRAGSPLALFGSAGTGSGQFSNPRAVAVDSTGNLYVADTGNNRVQKFSSSFAYLTQWGSAGSGNGQFNGVQGICVDPTNTYVYVADYTNGRVQKFTTAGAFVATWTSPSPTDVACDPAGNLYVPSYFNSRVYKYSSAGALLATISSPGTGNGNLSGPQGAAVDRYGDLYVTDSNNLRVVRFSTAGTWLANFGSPGTAVNQFQNLFGIAVDTTGVVWTPDVTQNNLKQWFPVPVALRVTSDTNPVLYNSVFNFTVTASPSASQGSVNLLDGATVVGTATLTGGSGSQQANIQNSNFTAIPGVPILHAGSHSITAVFTGDGTCSGATSPAYAQTVNANTLSLTFSPVSNLYQEINPAGYDDLCTFRCAFYLASTATPVPQALPLAGTLQLVVDGVPVSANGGFYALPGVIPEPGDYANLSFSGASPVTHTVMLSYVGGGPDYSATAAGPLSQTVLPSAVSPALVGQFGRGGSLGYGALTIPSAVALDAAGDVYVADRAGSVSQFTPSGGFVASWPVAGTPTGIAVDANGHVQVADSLNGRVLVYTNSGQSLGQWGSVGSGAGYFTNWVRTLAADRYGDVLVGDGSGRVQVFHADGTYQYTYGTDAGYRAQGLAVDPAGTAYVALNASGELVGVSGLLQGTTTFWRKNSATILTCSAIAADGRGDVYAGEQAGQHSLYLFAHDGAHLATWAMGGGATGVPSGMAAGPAGDLYVADGADGIVQHYVTLQALTSVADVGGDNGGQVRIRFSANALDSYLAPAPVTSYVVYRQVAPGFAPAGARAAAKPAASAKPSAVQLDGWDVVATIPASGDTSYVAVVPTLADSNASGIHRFTYFVRALTGTPGVYYDSAPDSGWSVDNLPPPVPAPFTAAYASGATHLHWGPSPAGDFWYFRLYRGTSAGFTPGPGSLVTTLSDTTYADAGAAGSFYELTAVDVNGNESAPAQVTPSGTAGVPAIAPLAFALDRPGPNPARAGALVVTFALADAAPARLELLDVAGRVAASANASGAGRHTVDLAAGRALPPGLYLVRLTQGGRVAVRRVAVAG